MKPDRNQKWLSVRLPFCAESALTRRFESPGYGRDFPVRDLIAPKMIVPTKSMMPMIASHKSPLNTNPTTLRIAQATRRIIMTAHMFLMVRLPTQD